MMESGICSHPLRFESDEDNRALDEYVAVELDVLLQKREAVKMESSSLMAGRVTAAVPCIPRQATGSRPARPSPLLLPCTVPWR
jgi:hypothetical protein